MKFYMEILYSYKKKNNQESVIPKNATLTAVGRGGHWIATFVTIPSVPSDPINKCFRW